MRRDPDRYRRRSTRLAGFDYSQPGAYFITICAHQRGCLFGEMEGDQVRLSAIGAIVAEEWARSAAIRQEIELDAFVIMPNHIHAIVIIRRGDRPVAPAKGAHIDAPVAPTRDTPTGPAKRSLGALIAGFKAAATRRINETRATPGLPVWQRGYYEHIIRDEAEWDRIRAYIEGNPDCWAKDQENPIGKRRNP